MKLSIVVPCYNEEEVLPETTRVLLQLLDELESGGHVNEDSRIVFVDDGSHDQTWALIREWARAEGRVEGIKLSRNRGHQNALLAGLLGVEGDAVLSMDADLQDDPGVVGEMLEQLELGHDVVLGVRSSRSSDGFFKRATAKLFYRLMRRGAPGMVVDHADFRLMSRRAVEELRGFPEANLYLRGLVTLVGLPTAQVSYGRRARHAGVTKYPLRRMFAFAFDGLSSFTALPLRVISWLGILTFIGASGLFLWAVCLKLFTDSTIAGWTSTVGPLYALGGIQLLGIGVLGEYLAKIYLEVKRRPRYIVEEATLPLWAERPDEINGRMS